jgi:hypothetical protein
MTLRRIAERVSGLQLQWFLTDWTQTTNTIDYAISEVEEQDNKTTVLLKRKGLMPMPLEILIQLKNGDTELRYIPISLMRGEKENPYELEWTVEKDWNWANPEYSLVIDKPKEEIQGYCN